MEKEERRGIVGASGPAKENLFGNRSGEAVLKKGREIRSPVHLCKHFKIGEEKKRSPDSKRLSKGVQMAKRAETWPTEGGQGIRRTLLHRE